MFKDKDTKNSERGGEEEKEIIEDSTNWEGSWDLSTLKKHKKKILTKLECDKEFGKRLILGVAKQFIDDLEKGKKADDKVFTFVAKLINNKTYN